MICISVPCIHLNITTLNFTFYNVHLSPLSEETNDCVNNFLLLYLSPEVMTWKMCLLIQKLKWEYHFLGRHQSFSEQNTVAGSFPKINSPFASTIKSPQTIVYAPRFGNRWLNLMHFHLNAWHQVFTKAAFTHMVAICKDISYQFEMQSSLGTRFITERACSEAEQVLQQLTN